MVDYRNLRLNNLNSKQFRHLKLLVFWPVFGFVFSLLERFGVTDSYHIVHCTFDDLIPFCEYFLIPYLFWFLFVSGMLFYTLLFDVESFKKYMKYIIFTYSITIVIYLIYPTAQNLRPEVFTHNNILTHFVAMFYAFDTNTNVCPSIHVIGSVAAMLAGWNSKHFNTPVLKSVFLVIAIFISASTVFLKQHSVLDVVAALPVCIVFYLLVYGRKTRYNPKIKSQIR